MKTFSRTFKLGIIVAAAGAVAAFAFVFDYSNFQQNRVIEPQAAQASCDPTGNPYYPPEMYGIVPPSGNYADPSTIPVHGDGMGGYECQGDPMGGFGWEYVDVSVGYTITNSSGAVVYNGYWSANPCTVAICMQRIINFTHNVPASTWPAGSYNIVASASGAGGWSNEVSSSFTITRTPPTDFSVSCSPASTTITAGDTTFFNLTTSTSNGFSSPVTWTHSLSPSSGSLPSVSYTNNGQVPSSVTTANVGTTSGVTTAGTYNITFTATGGSLTRTCNTSLTVNAVPPSPNYVFTISPTSTDTLMGSDVLYTVSLTCNNGATGPIYGLTASSPFAGLTYEFMTIGSKAVPGTVTSQISCGQTIRLYVRNTGGIDLGQASNPQARLGQNITVTGTGN